MGVRTFSIDLAHVHPARGAWPVAIRAALSALIPLFVLWGIDRLDWAMFAAFGAMTCLFGRTVPLRPRVWQQIEAGSVLLIAVVLGTLIGMSDQRAWLLIPAAAIVATAVAIVSHRRRWHPPGVLFHVFALGALASTPHTAADLPPALFVTTASALLALALTIGSGVGARALSRRRGADAAPSAASPPTGPEWPLRHYLVRYGIGVLVAGSLATAIGIGHPYWAIVAAVVPMAAANTMGRIVRSTQRVIGTFVGVAVTALVLHFEPPAVVLIVLIAAFQAGAELTIGRNYALAMVFVTPMALCMVQLAHPQPVAPLVTDRFVETVLGIAVAVVITLVTHERRQPGDSV